MKQSLSLVMVALLLVVMGCSLDSLTGDKDSAPTRDDDTSSSSDKSSSSDDSSSDDSSSDDSSSSSGGGLTMGNYEKIKTGMAYDEVAKLLGSKGEETSSRSSGDTEYKSMKWEGEKFVRVYVNFKDDKVTSKSQTNLTGGSSSKGSADINKEKYDKIKTGMSLKEVQDVIGSKGEETSSSSIGKSAYQSYKWKGEKYSFITVRLKDDKVTSKSQYGMK